MGFIADNLQKVRSLVPEGVRLVAVSKTHPTGSILEAWEAGQRCFGENKAQELATKAPLLPGDIEWHFIGHLQTNKVKLVIPWVHTIHSVDSLKLLREIDAAALKEERPVKCLLQFHIATEETKFGLSWQEAEEIMHGLSQQSLHLASLCGVMGMATYTTDENLIEQEFRNLATIFRQLKQTWFAKDSEFKEISMGMTDDYPLAIQAGSTMVRVGSGIFGTRNNLP